MNHAILSANLWTMGLNLAYAVVAMLIGNLVIYALGIPWLMLATGFDLGTAIEKGLLPFVFGDVLKLALAGIAFPAAWWLVGRRTGER